MSTTHLPVLCLAGLFACSAAAAAVPDPSTSAVHYPDAAKLGAPPAIKAGTRLTYFGTNSTLAGTTTYYELGRDGKWVERGTGRTVDAAQSGGVGYSVVRVGHLDKQVALLNVANYLLNPSDKTVSSPTIAGYVSQAGCALDYWIHPDVLKNVRDEKVGSTTIARQTYALGERQFNAIRFTTMTTRTYLTEVYDLNSGIKLFQASSNAGGVEVKRFKEDDNFAQAKVGSTFNSTATLMEVKDVDVPWKDAAAPPWVGQFQEIRYGGAVSSVNPNFPAQSTAVNSSLTPAARGDGWFRGTLSVVVDNGLPPVPAKTDYATGSASIGGLWIAPKALANLRADQVIDNNEVTRTRIIVSQIAQGYVTISEVGATFQADFMYEGNSGVLAAVSYRQKNAVGMLVTQMRMTGQR